jgi:hypothetical protein
VNALATVLVTSSYRKLFALLVLKQLIETCCFLQVVDTSKQPDWCADDLQAPTPTLPDDEPEMFQELAEVASGEAQLQVLRNLSTLLLIVLPPPPPPHTHTHTLTSLTHDIVANSNPLVQSGVAEYGYSTASAANTIVGKKRKRFVRDSAQAMPPFSSISEEEYDRVRAICFIRDKNAHKMYLHLST